MRHVVWDWNGTLFADQHVVLDAFNAVVADAGLPPMDASTYRRLYTRPVQVFYERVLDRRIDDTEWQRIDTVFHDAYAAGMAAAALADDALDALEHVARSGRTQSLLSMLRHHQVVPLVDHFELGGHFALVDGLTGVSGRPKATDLEAHLEVLAHLCGDDPTQVLVIGDALDDAVAAAHVGATCVLYDGGSHRRAELERAAVPVAASLLDALDVAGLA